MARDHGLLAALAESADAAVVIVDSLKDVAVLLSEDESGGGYNRARQHALAAGIELIELHHTRKAAKDGRSGDADGIDEIYGSVWLTHGAGGQ